MTPDASGWRSSERYAHVADMTAPDVAWEWLRRNESYDRDFQALSDNESELGALTAQPLRTAGAWGQLPAGTEVNGLAALFPRIDAEAVAAV